MDGILMYKGLIEVPNNNELKLLILIKCHDDPLAGHLGVFKTYELLKRTFHWPGSMKYTKKYVSSCDICQRNKMARHKKYGILRPLPIPDSPWTSISMDMITHLPISNGFNAILVIIDRFTK